MTHKPSPTLRTRLLFGAFLLSSAFALSVSSSSRSGEPEPTGANDAFILRTSSASSVSSSARSTSSVRRARSSSSRRSYVRPPRRRTATGFTLRPAATSSRAAIKAGCGDKLITGTEKCDDGNTTAGDGCSAACVIETGFMCDTSQPTLCWSRCGDGTVAADERCDDGNLIAGDGCNATCRIEIGYKCAGSPSVCAIPAYCGNNVKEDTEQCDDGNTSLGDGCTPECKTE